MTNSHEQPEPVTDIATLAFGDAVKELETEPHTLWKWSRRFALFLSATADADPPIYSQEDLSTLRLIQSLQQDGCGDKEIAQRLAVQQMDSADILSAAYDASSLPTNDSDQDSDQPDSTAALAERVSDAELPRALRDIFGTLNSSQQAVLNNQATVREIMGVVVQDNFSLKEDNRKLRERMLELERSLAEYQRREETRKERLESRLRALEGTVGGLQQQIAQLVQLLRKRRRRSGWFW